MLTIGEKFPSFTATAVASAASTARKFAGAHRAQLSGANGRSCSSGRRTCTFVCPTEIAAFGKLNRDFADRDAQVLGVSIDSEFVTLRVAQ